MSKYLVGDVVLFKFAGTVKKGKVINKDQEHYWIKSKENKYPTKKVQILKKIT